MTFSCGLNLIIGNKDANYYEILKNIGDKFDDYCDVHDYQLILKYLHKHDITNFIVDNIFSELHPGKHEEAAQKLHEIAVMSGKTIIATCYSPIAASAIHPCYVYVADGDKIVGDIDEGLPPDNVLTPDNIFSTYMI